VLQKVLAVNGPVLNGRSDQTATQVAARVERIWTTASAATWPSKAGRLGWITIA